MITCHCKKRSGRLHVPTIFILAEITPQTLDNMQDGLKGHSECGGEGFWIFCQWLNHGHPLLYQLNYAAKLKPFQCLFIMTRWTTILLIRGKQGKMIHWTRWYSLQITNHMLFILLPCLQWKQLMFLKACVCVWFCWFLSKNRWVIESMFFLTVPLEVLSMGKTWNFKFQFISTVMLEIVTSLKVMRGQQQA